MHTNRCNWKHLDSDTLYQEYHDNEWGELNTDETYLFEMLLLESFQSGLSWLTILKKRENFKIAFDNFNVTLISSYDELKIEELCKNDSIIKNKLKISSAVSNAACFIKVQKEYGSFLNYLYSFTNNKILYNQNSNGEVTNEISDKLSKDLKKRGFKFLGSITCFSYLEAVGIFNNHSVNCYKHKKW